MNYGKKLFITGFITICACLFLNVSMARAVTFTVTKTADTNDGECSVADCSLREAIAAANFFAGADTIVFEPSVFAPPKPVQQIFLALNLSELSITDNLTINGPGARQLLINGNSDDRIFNISEDSSVSIKDLAILNGHAVLDINSQIPQIDCEGGGIKNSGVLTLNRIRLYLNTADCHGGGIANSGSLTVLYSIIGSNTANVDGGGIYSLGSTSIANTTVSDNKALGRDGGGIWSGTSGYSLNLNNVTISHNWAKETGGGIRADVIPPSPGSSVNKRIRNTIVSNNNAANGQDVLGYFDSQGSNLIRAGGNDSFYPGNPNAKGDYVGTAAAPIDPMLGPLNNNGGASNTRALLPGSPAIDKGDDCVTWTACGENKPPVPLVYDQRFTGFNRKSGAAVDIGAYEVEPAVTSINGTVIYALTPLNQSQKTVPGVTVIAAGATFASDTTDASGNYSISNLTAGGQYNANASKNGGANGITPFDATLILRHVAAGGQGVNALNANQQLAADTDADNNVTAFDATQILRYVAAGGANPFTGQTGKWKFLPASRTYQSLGNSLAGENYEAILVGEVNGDWAPPVPGSIPEMEIQAENKADIDLAETTVSLSENVPASGGEIIIVPVTLAQRGGKTISSYSLAVEFDPDILQPDSAMPVETADSMSREMAVVCNTEQPGRVGIAAAGDGYSNGVTPAQEVLVKLRFRVVGSRKGLKSRTSSVRFHQPPIFEDELGAALNVKTINGSISIATAETGKFNFIRE